jgi:lipopolysaccharide biosynthesis protein
VNIFFLKKANELFRYRKYKEALELYHHALESLPNLSKTIEFNIELTKQALLKEITNNTLALDTNISDNRPVLDNAEYCNITLYSDVDFMETLDNIKSDYQILLDAFKQIEKLDNENQIANILYCMRYPDISDAIRINHFLDANSHYEKFGRQEGRIFDTKHVIKKYEERLKKLLALCNSKYSVCQEEKYSKVNNSIKSIPFYFDENFIPDYHYSSKLITVGIHLHLYYLDMQSYFVEKLNNIPIDYDIYISVPENAQIALIEQYFKNNLIKANNIYVENVPNRGRDIAPFIIQFGKRLMEYDYILHLHTKKSIHDNYLNNWLDDIIDLLLGSKQKIEQIFNIFLNKSAKMIFPEGQCYYIKDPSGWGDNYEAANLFLAKYSDISIENFETVEFPEGSMFWARSVCLKDYLSLPLKWDDFPIEPISPDGTLAHVLERLLLIFSSQCDGKYIKLQKSDSMQDYRFYECQRDYSSSIIHSDVKVLAYYLPQFHTIPENDEWHGKGFTEWTKVKAANPLFEGHYQQHIPHPDIGYYLINSPDSLHKQADLMRKSGVYGQIFYHYWFTGRLILEEPAQMLLKNKDVDMPFCFCWANENWTKRWDGNEDDVLLAQNYSPEDALHFIKYLIPFFLDGRYIKINDRPVIFVYRPSLIPCSQQYIDIWNRECFAHKINPPYVIAVLTRGTNDPIEVGMDAGVERVLHDWTGGNVQDIRGYLNKYAPVKGSVLEYADVANYYIGQTNKKKFTYFRSLIPIWDNTARYGSEAYIVHGSTPEKFQNWLNHTIEYTQKNLPLDKRLIVINAWNEWAEGAHLEPDSYFGYSYLNSIGRVLSGLPFNHYSSPVEKLCSDVSIYIDIPPHIINQLVGDDYLRTRFFHFLQKSTIFSKCKISINTTEFLSCSYVLSNIVEVEKKDVDFILQFRRVALVSPECIENMILFALYHNEATILANAYDSRNELVKVESNGSVSSSDAYHNPLLLMPQTRSKHFKMCTCARVFVATTSSLHYSELPKITTIVRFHKLSDINELKNALLCLAAMDSCIVIPFIAAQDLDKKMRSKVEELLIIFSYNQNYLPIVNYFYSENNNGDLRSQMLNESIRKVTTRYASFLDYDDLLMPHAFSYLIKRLTLSCKAVSFGRVFQTNYSSKDQMFIKRERTYEYGYSYDDFFNLNHAPLHSFLLDLSLLDISTVDYDPYQRFMEDYYFTLQIFTRDNCDWDSLTDNYYIGDYIHSIDRPHTLAVSDVDTRQHILSNEHYVVCESKICHLRMKLLQN